MENTMREIDPSQLESEFDALESDEFEYAFAPDSEILTGGEIESPYSEEEEMDLAAELMGITDEAELDQFLGKLLKGAWRGIRKVGSFVGRVARPLGKILKGVAKKALPFVGGALGSFIPIPGVGTAVGSALGSAVSKALEAELEGMSVEDQEFEMARRFVRVAGTAAKQAALTQPSVDPQNAAKAAVLSAVRRHVPGLAAPSAITTVGRRGSTGRWLRRGSKLVVLGA
jgi:hypothetical protein